MKILIFSLLVLGVASGFFLHGKSEPMKCINPDDCGNQSTHTCLDGKCVIILTRTFYGMIPQCPPHECQLSPTNYFFHPFSLAKKCSTIIDCGSSQLCVDGKCVVDNGHGGLCSSDAFCPNGFICIDGKCSENRRRINSMLHF